MSSRWLLCAPILGIVLGTTAFANSVAASAGTRPDSAPETAATVFGTSDLGNHNRVAELDCAFLNSAIFSSGQEPTKRQSASASELQLPRYEVFLGYSHVRFGLPGSSGQTSFNFDGGSAGLTYNLNRWLGVTGEVSLYNITGLPSGASGTYLFGPRFSHRTDRFNLYTQSLFGGAKLKSDITAPPSTTFFGNSLHANSFAAALGAGFDVKVSNHAWWRVLEGEYLLTRFNHANINQQNNVRVSTGLVFRLGKLPLPNHAPTISVTAIPAEVVAGSGQTVSLSAEASDPDNDPLSYTWSATAGEIEGTGAEVRWKPTSTAPGVYIIHSKIEDGRGGTAEASTTVTVRPQPNRAPIVHCEAAPTTAVAGERINITATGIDPDGDALTYSFDAEGKTLTAANSSTVFDTAGLTPGYYTVECSANDGRGGLATASIDVEVKAPEQKGLETRLSLHSVYFPTGMPTIQSPRSGLLPSQQHTLLVLAGDFKKYLTFQPDAHLILQGHADPRGGAKYNQRLSELRVESTKAFLVEHGISPDLVETHGLGIEEPLSPDQVKHTVQQDASLDATQRLRLLRNLRVVALAQSRRVDIELSTTGEKSVRAFPFNAEDALDLLNPSATAGGKQAGGKRSITTKKAN